MSVLDFFAAHAMAGILAGHRAKTAPEVATMAYQMAEALLDERAEWHEKNRDAAIPERVEEGEF
jgi:hypothetical protein